MKREIKEKITFGSSSSSGDDLLVRHCRVGLACISCLTGYLPLLSRAAHILLRCSPTPNLHVVFCIQKMLTSVYLLWMDSALNLSVANKLHSNWSVISDDTCIKMFHEHRSNRNNRLTAYFSVPRAFSYIVSLNPPPPCKIGKVGIFYSITQKKKCELLGLK